MARQYRPPPAYVATLQQGQGGFGGAAPYNAAAVDKYNNEYNALTQVRSSVDGKYADATGYGYNPAQAAAYARSEQERYQGGPGVSAQALGQAQYDAQQRNALQSVGAQRGSGGQAQGLRAAMMNTNQAAGASQQAQTSATQEQMAQRQAILSQRLAAESQQQDAVKQRNEEKSRADQKKSEQDADTTSGMVKMVGSMFGGMSDERAKNRTDGGKKRKAPKLVIMLGGG